MHRWYIAASVLSMAVVWAQGSAPNPPYASDEYLLLGDAARGAGEPMIAVDPTRTAGVFGDDLQNLAIDDRSVHIVWADSRSGFQGVRYGRIPLSAY